MIFKYEKLYNPNMDQYELLLAEYTLHIYKDNHTARIFFYRDSPEGVVVERRVTRSCDLEILEQIKTVWYE